MDTQRMADDDASRPVPFEVSRGLQAWIARPVASSLELPRDRRDRCEERHVPADVPRRLCMFRQAGSWCDDLLAVSVSTCSQPPGGSVPPALIKTVGELSSSTVDDFVGSSLLEYIRFARNAVIDLSGLATIDDCGVALLDDLADAAWLVGGALTLHDPAFIVEHVIRFCGVSDRVCICSPA